MYMDKNIKHKIIYSNKYNLVFLHKNTKLYIIMLLSLLNTL